MIGEPGGRGGDEKGRGLRAALALLLVGAAACGGGKASGSGSGGGSGATGNIGSSSGTDNDGGTPSSIWTTLSPAQVSVQGGAALSAAGQGQNGGVVHLVSQGDISFDPIAGAGQDDDPGHAIGRDGRRRVGAGRRSVDLRRRGGQRGRRPPAGVTPSERSRPAAIST